MSPRSNEQFKQIRKESKAKILVAALELFAVDGYHNTSISKIAKHAGISKGLMYNYFKSKEELLTQVVTMSLDDAKEITANIFPQLEKMTPKEVIKMMIELFFQMLLENKTMWKLTLSLAMQVSNMPSVKKVITKTFDDVFMQLEMVLQMNGYQDYEVEARILAAQLDGIGVHYLIFEKNYDLESVKNKLIKRYCG